MTLIVLSSALLLTGISAAVYAAGSLAMYRRLREENRDILEEYVTPVSVGNEAEKAGGELSPAPAVPEEEAAQTSCPVEVDFSGLLERNGDTVGWICIEDTPVSYPVAQAGDNFYYLTHNLDGTDTGYGIPFMDASCSPALSGTNTVLYGHNMNDGSMFAAIVGYRNQEFFDEHQDIWFLTPGHVYRVLPYSCYVTVPDSAAYASVFESGSARAEWVKETARLSDVTSYTVPKITDRILTLSTCSYEFKGARTVLHGVMRELL